MKAAFTSSSDRVLFTWRKRHVRSVSYLHKHFVITFLPVARIAKLIFKKRKAGFYPVFCL